MNDNTPTAAAVQQILSLAEQAAGKEATEAVMANAVIDALSESFARLFDRTQELPGMDGPRVIGLGVTALGRLCGVAMTDLIIERGKENQAEEMFASLERVFAAGLQTGREAHAAAEEKEGA